MGTPLRNRNFTTIGSSSVKTVADRHRLAAYHNKHFEFFVAVGESFRLKLLTD